MSNRQLRIVVGDPASGRSYGLHLSRGSLWLVGAAAALLVAGLVLALISYARIAGVAEKARALEAENRALRRQSQRVADLKAEVDRLRSSEAKMLAIMGIDTLDVARLRYEEAWRDSAAADSASETEEPRPLRWPATGAISRGYRPTAGNRTRHMGVDIAAPAGSPVRAVLPGRVAFAGQDSIFGSMIVLEHGEGLTTIYGHNSELLVTAGDTVRQGDVIALVGSTGRSSAPHLHFEVREGDQAVDPHKFLGRRR